MLLSYLVLSLLFFFISTQNSILPISFRYILIFYNNDKLYNINFNSESDVKKTLTLKQKRN